MNTFPNQRYDLWFTQSEHHNLPIVNGIGQKVGRTFEAKNVKYTTNSKEASLAMDIAAYYPLEAGITSWSRIVKLNRTHNQIEVSDDFLLSAQPKSLQQVFMTICDIDVSQKGKIKFSGDKTRLW